ncbi:hypothetical protein AC844P1_00016 [Anaerostipes phage AC844P1]|nr:hypothetical protein AC844P1_00016 [Anaerostipes phage AC844P1]WAX05286.1 hypothetical protein AC844P2_00016 [Anaerostipes phage AC844P2]WAX05345.1 hypothetical protein AC844P3_00016 [Anaerostipes phage AC844P3]
MRSSANIMASYRQKISVQKRKQETPRPETEDSTDIIQTLQHRLGMYRKVISGFDPGSTEWDICQEGIYDTLAELSRLEQGVYMEDG